MDFPTNERAVSVHRTILAIVFALAGSGKLLGAAPMAELFAHFDLGVGFMRLIGVAEVAGAVGMLVPRVTPLAAAGLALVMIGAITEHVLHDPLVHALPPLVLLGLCVHVAYSTRAAGRTAASPLAGLGVPLKTE